MFERIYKRPTALARHRNGPLAEERINYLRHLKAKGLSVKSLRVVAITLLVVARTLDLANRPEKMIGLAEVEHYAARWARRRVKTAIGRPGDYSRATYLLYATGWLQFLGRLALPAVPQHPFSDHITAFATYLRTERGLSEATIRGWTFAAQQSLNTIASTNGSLADITISHIDGFLLHMVNSGGYSRNSTRHYADGLRAFFRYAEARLWCRKGLADAIQAPRVYSQTSVPTGPSWDDVQKLIATTEGNRPADIRDRAIIMLLAVYGLRAGEVTRLRLDDIDWDREMLSIRCPKNRQARTYPLARSVGDAILRYLTEVRPPSAHRELFLTFMPPIRPMRSLWYLVARRLRSLGVSIPRHGPHALRHACATHLLAQGLPLKEIGDHLGHRNPDATRIYAKVDLNSLRQVAEFDLGGLI